MADLLPMGFLQFLDANGDPLSGGSVTYEDPAAPGNHKAIWADQAATVPVQNPVPLDQAGRPFSGGSEVGIWGTGLYRMFVRDLNGALQWSAITASPAADAGLAQEIADRKAADALLQTQISNEVTRATTAENNLTTALNNAINTLNTADANLQHEIDDLKAEDINLQNQINNLTGGGPPASNVMAKNGTTTTIGGFGGSSAVSVTFTAPFPHHLVSFVVDSSKAAALGDVAGPTRFTLLNNSAVGATGILEVFDGATFQPIPLPISVDWNASGF